MREFRLPIPEATRRAVLQRANKVCEDCCRDDMPLTLHHLTYLVEVAGDGPDAIFGKETPADLDALCWECHQARHRDEFGNYYEDPNERDGVNDQIERLMAKD